MPPSKLSHKTMHKPMFLTFPKTIRFHAKILYFYHPSGDIGFEYILPCSNRYAIENIWKGFRTKKGKKFLLFMLVSIQFSDQIESKNENIFQLFGCLECKHVLCLNNQHFYGFIFENIFVKKPTFVLHTLSFANRFTHDYTFCFTYVFDNTS